MYVHHRSISIFKIHVLRIIIVCVSLLLSIAPFNPSAYSDSLIDKVIKSRQSIVHIYAYRTKVYPSPAASAAFDPKTGKMVIAREFKALQAQSMGAGVIIQPSGLIVTNLHTIKFATQLAVVLFDGTILSGTILHLLPQHDLALIKIEPPYPLIAIHFADSDRVKLGDDIINIGSSELLKETISGGKITGLGTTPSSDMVTVELIRVNIDLYKGDSGGPLLNAQGDLIGMIAAKSRGKEKTTFAIPSNKIKMLYWDYFK